MYALLYNVDVVGVAAADVVFNEYEHIAEYGLLQDQLNCEHTDMRGRQQFQMAAFNE